jgi:hypothetical protein
VTEKVFDAFEAGTVPVYFGPVADLASRVPNGSFIDGVTFLRRPAELAELLRRLDADDEALLEYHRWRTKARRRVRRCGSLHEATS